MKSYQKQVVDLLIRELSPDGNGIGEISYPSDHTSLCEVPFTLPGDHVQARLIRKDKGLYQGQLQDVLQPSPERIAYPCSHFTRCGGCRWQHIPYHVQLAYKEQMIRQYLAPYLNEQTIFHPIVACDPPWQYRNKMEFSFSSDQSKNRYLGLYLYGERNHVFNLQECHLVYPWAAQAVQATRTWWENSTLDAYHPMRNTGSLRTLIVREGIRTGDRLVMLTVSGNPDFALHKQHLESFVHAIRQSVEPQDPNQKLSIFLRIQQVAKGQQTQFYEMVLFGPDHLRETLFIQDQSDQAPVPVNFHISPSAFFQPNPRQAEKIYSYALQMAQIPEGALVYDLYCGTGTVGICAAKRAKQVIGIELSPESVVDARENVKLNGLTNVTILEGDVGKVLADLKHQPYQNQPAVVLVDPPRSGLDTKAIQHLLELRSPKVIYVSCNPKTQAANLAELTRHGYQVGAVQPVDQFPQTLHVENVVVLNYSGS